MRVRDTKRVYITATDAKSRKSRCITLYGTTAKEVIGRIRQIANTNSATASPSCQLENNETSIPGKCEM